MTATILLIAFGAVVSSTLVLLVIGMRAPVRHECEVSEQYPVLMPKVFDAVATVSAYPSWRSNVRNIEASDLGVTAFIEVGPRRSTTYIVEDEVRPGQGPTWSEPANAGARGPTVARTSEPRIELAKRVHRIAPGGRFSGRWIFGFESLGLQTRLTIIEQGEIPNPLMRGIARLFYSPTKNMTLYLIDLRRYLTTA